MVKLKFEVAYDKYMSLVNVKVNRRRFKGCFVFVFAYN